MRDEFDDNTAAESGGAVAVSEGDDNSVAEFNDDSDGDTLREECGIFAINETDAAPDFAVLGLHALQHRGQEAVGLVSRLDGRLRARRGLGTVGRVFSNDSPPPRGRAALGHLRYSTAGDAEAANIQPLLGETRFGQVAMAHNGNITNAGLLRRALLERGMRFASSGDTEVVFQRVAASRAASLEDALADAATELQGAWSLALLTERRMVAMRDPHGFRPLVLGRLNGAAVVASETCALDIIGAEHERDIRPGEILSISDDGGEESRIVAATETTTVPERFCAFEFIYFMRPNSAFMGLEVSAVRERLGAELFEESHVAADVVVPVPDSGVHSAVGYAAASGLPYSQGILRSHYTGRTFIEPTEKIRHLGVKLKLSVNPASVRGRRVILIDDSIVRGTTMPKIVALLRRAGAVEIHVRVASPPFRRPCHYGIDTPSRDELAAHRFGEGELNERIGGDSLSFLSLEGLYRALGGERGEGRRFCDACMSGEYPTVLADLEAGLPVGRI
ncbi:MAG: amidophosphoribosyltransferase, partial [Alphaproteobacteria bacterium]|nr:amidophosphoribosyltransferase [Alphaproteobacteria bacterium]